MHPRDWNIKGTPGRRNLGLRFRKPPSGASSQAFPAGKESPQGICLILGSLLPSQHRVSSATGGQGLVDQVTRGANAVLWAILLRPPCASTAAPDQGGFCESVTNATAENCPSRAALVRKITAGRQRHAFRRCVGAGCCLALFSRRLPSSRHFSQEKAIYQIFLWASPPHLQIP